MRQHPLALAAMIAAPWLTVGCAHDRLDPTFALTYNALFAAQLTPHAGRDVGPLSGEESKRILRKYQQGLGGEDKDGSTGNSAGAGGGMPMLMGAGSGNSGAPNPFALKGR